MPTSRHLSVPADFEAPAAAHLFTPATVISAGGLRAWPSDRTGGFDPAANPPPERRRVLEADRNRLHPAIRHAIVTDRVSVKRVQILVPPYHRRLSQPSSNDVSK